jgi:hypothetical protein
VLLGVVVAPAFLTRGRSAGAGYRPILVRGNHLPSNRLRRACCILLPNGGMQNAAAVDLHSGDSFVRLTGGSPLFGRPSHPIFRQDAFLEN